LPIIPLFLFLILCVLRDLCGYVFWSSRVISGEGQKGERGKGIESQRSGPYRTHFEEGLAISGSVFEFVHPELNQRVDFFSGGYLFTEEGKLPYRGKEVLYLVGMAGIETSCCGTGGCAFIKVPGYIRDWKKERNETGRPVSEVERVEAQDQQREIQDLLKEKYPGFSQIEFL